ncbi:membrane protein insertion efficiency factor YidD [Micromonospora sp. NPDC047738]|uniref:membrane protein insertion efficiency factor YidD n=1 Tax=unclassified Micromonospora TaxID=2617518 RepID=UPI0033F56395
MVAEARRRWDMPVTEPPCGACCYACTDGRADLAAWLSLPAVIVRAVCGVMASASTDLSPSASVPTRLAIGLVKGYRQHISSRTAARCRFVPTCSAYGLAVIGRYGVLRGCQMIHRRLIRCRPTVAFGTPDPVPLPAGHA